MSLKSLFHHVPKIPQKYGRTPGTPGTPLQEREGTSPSAILLPRRRPASVSPEIDLGQGSAMASLCLNFLARNGARAARFATRGQRAATRFWGDPDTQKLGHSWDTTQGGLQSEMIQ